MHINANVIKNVDIVIPQRVIYDRDHKNILPIYMALYLKANHLMQKNFWESMTLKQLGGITGVYDGVSFRGAHYNELFSAVSTLEDMGYIKTNGLDRRDHRKYFSYSMVDVNPNSDKYVLLPVDEYFYVINTMVEHEITNVKKDTIWRVYCCMRFYMNMWQRTYDKKYPAWVGRLDDVSNWLGITTRTFSRFFCEMQDCGLMFVTYGAQIVGIDGFGKRSDTIVVFPFLAEKTNPTHITMLVQVRVKEKKGMSGCTWYKPGYRVLKKSKPEDMRKDTEDIAITDIDEATRKQSVTVDITACDDIY